MGNVTTIDFNAKAKTGTHAPAVLADLFYGPFNHEDFLTLRRIQTIAQRDMDEDLRAKEPKRSLLYEGYSFDQHMTLTLATNHLSIHLQRVTGHEKSEFPEAAEFADLRQALGKLRSYIQIQHVLIRDVEQEELVKSIDSIKSHRDFYIDMIDRIRKIEDKIDNYTPPLRASVTYIGHHPE